MTQSPVCLGYDTTGIPDIGKESVETAESKAEEKPATQQWEEIVRDRAESRTAWESQTRENFRKMTMR